MKRKAAKRNPRATAPQSIFHRKPPAMVPASEVTAEQFIEATSPDRQFARLMETISKQADAAEKAAGLADAAGHVARLRQGVKILKAMVRDEVSREAIALEAVDLGQDWLALRVDANAARAMEAHRARIPRKSVSDEDVALALQKFDSRAAQADYLGISVRQLTNRIKGRRK